MSTALDGSIKVYSRRVDQALRYTETAELSALLAERDGIRDALREGIALDDLSENTLRAADTRLLAGANIIARHFPGFDAESAICEAIGAPTPARP